MMSTIVSLTLKDGAPLNYISQPLFLQITIVLISTLESMQKYISGTCIHPKDIPICR